MPARERGTIVATLWMGDARNRLDIKKSRWQDFDHASRSAMIGLAVVDAVGGRAVLAFAKPRTILVIVSRKLVLAGLLVLAFAGPSQAASQSFCSDDPRYPEPQDDNLVFYLQRSDNTNTIVYAVNRRADGTVDARNPVLVYWRWYEEGGDKRELTFLQRNLAFGVQIAPSKDYPGDYVARLNAYPNIPVLVDETKDGNVRALMRISGEPAQLICVYVEWRQPIVIIPQVLYIDFFGRTLDGAKKVVERLQP